MENMPDELDIAKAMTILPVLAFILAVAFGVPVLWLLGIAAAVSAGVWLGTRNLEEFCK